MTPDEYLQRILDEQTFDSEDDELKILRERIAAVKDMLAKAFSASSPSIRQAGSLAKGTMIVESYDGDVTCYFEHEDTEPGDSLKKIYDSVEAALAADYHVQRKPSALRVTDKNPDTLGTDFHIDVIPGRFVDDDKEDVHLYRNSGEKAYLKTNLQKHIDHVKESGVRGAIRLMKLWNTRNGTQAKTFVLELLVIKLLDGKADDRLSDQLTHILTEFRDRADDLSVDDPANPSGNDLKPLLDECRWSLSAVAGTSLSQIESGGWEAVFGTLQEEADDEAVADALKVAAASVSSGTRPWSE